MKKLQTWFGLAAIALLSQSCISVAPLGSHYNAFASTGQAVIQAKAIHQDTTDFLKDVRSASSTPNAPAYLELEKQLKALDGVYQSMKPEMDKNDQMYKKLVDLSKGRTELRSDQAEWPAYLDLIKETQANMASLKPKIEAYNSAANAFTAKMDAAGVNRYSVAETQTQLDGMSGQVKSMTDALRAKLKEARDRIAKASQSTLGLVSYNKKKEIINQIEAKLPGIDAKAAEFKEVAEQFRKESAGKKKVYSGPGINRVDAVDALNKKSAEFKALTDPVQALIAEFNK